MAAGDPGSPARYYSSTAVETSLQSSIPAQSQGQSNTSFIVASISGFPTSYPYTLIVDPDTSKEEVLTVTSGSSTTLTVTRGADNTQAVAHSAGAVVRHGVSGRDFRESENHIAARGYDIDQAILDAANQTHVHGIATGDGVIVGTSKAQTLTNKTYSAGTFTGSFTASSATFVSPTISGSPVITGLSSAGMSSSSATPKSYVDAFFGPLTDAVISAASAATSATSAATSATSAATSATSAANSASAASTSASSALTSATSAANSATAAATSATSAAASASAASTSATSAAASATAAASSATTAAASVAAIASYAAAAATSETNAANSASAAATSATSASNSASAAATSATSAATSASSAATSATSAANSATAAASSATAAATSATSAANSASAAAGSESNASVSATSASISASGALTSANSAATSASSAAASYDQFDDRYLGSKTSDPTVDNDGNPLITGALYFNSVVGAMKVYDGAAWDLVAPDTSNFIDKSILAGKGSLISASTASTPVAITAPTTNGWILSADSATTSGLAWIAQIELTDSVTSTSTTSAATPNSVKQAYDLAASALAGLHFHDPVETATSSNITLSGTSAINGVSLVAGVTRVLVKDQTTQSENGVYIAQTSSWTRATDFDSWDEVYTSAVYVTGGGAAGESYITTVASTGTVGVTAITWALFSTNSVYTASSPILLAGDNFSLDTSGVTAGTYTLSTITVDTYGRITSASTGTAGSDPNPQIFMLMGA